MRKWFSMRTQAVAAAISMAVGVLFAVLPQDWIEERFGINPDVGNGSIERLFVAIPLAIAVALAVSAVASYRRHQAKQSSARASGLRQPGTQVFERVRAAARAT